jgi:hypothetical protein
MKINHFFQRFGEIFAVSMFVIEVTEVRLGYSGRVLRWCSLGTNGRGASAEVESTQSHHHKTIIHHSVTIKYEDG